MSFNEAAFIDAVYSQSSYSVQDDDDLMAVLHKYLPYIMPLLPTKHFFLLLYLLVVLRPPAVRAADNASDIKGVLGSWKETLQLKCRGGYGLHIIDSSFGNPLLAGETIYKNSRDAPHTKLVIQQHCEGQNACKVFVDPTTFGIMKSVGITEPKLAIIYACISSAQPGYSEEADTFQATPLPEGGWNVTIKSAREEADVTALRKSYMHLLDIEAECQDPIQVESPLHTLDAAENRCSEIEQCTFLIARPHKIELCKSNTYLNPRRAAGSMIHVKAFNAFGSATRLFKLHPNVQSICERHQLLGQAEGVRDAQDAADQCVEAGCDFFVMSTVNVIKGALSDFPNHVWLCKGSPIYIPFDGFVLGERRGASFACEASLSCSTPCTDQLQRNLFSCQGTCTKRPNS